METYSSAQQVLQYCVEALEKDSHDVWLATVVSTWGSSPRAPGAMLMWSPSTGPVGSVSGGCVEEALIRRLKAGELDRERPNLVTYGDDLQAHEKVKLPCGGILRLIVEHISPEHKAQVCELKQTLDARRGLARHISLSSGAWSWEASAPFSVVEIGEEFRIYLGPKRKLLIIGANQIAFYLAQFAAPLEFDVTVCDPAEDLGEYWQSSSVPVLKFYPDGFIDAQFNDSSCAIVAVSHDPRLDDMALLEALPSNAFYVGAMGSARTSAARRERLQQLEVSPALLQKLHAPIGIAIGSKSPAEIALSIAADLVKHYQQSHG